jgi:hypothetical protein
VDDWSCSNEGKPRLAYPSDPSSSPYDGHQYWQKEEILQEVTTSHPPATINSSLTNCTLNNGWCITAPELFLNGSEPLSGYNILAIEGALNGQSFACSGVPCNLLLNEGNDTFTFWALSFYGDSSTMGTFTAKVDTVSPNVGLDSSGSNGTGTWYVSPTTITATGSDSTSGLQSALLSVDNDAWQSSATLNDGVYTVTVQAQVYPELRAIFYQDNLEQAQQTAAFLLKYEPAYPTACDCLRRDLKDCLTFYQFPQTHWRFIRTSNAIERLFQKVKKRSHKMAAAFRNENSCLLLFYTVVRSLRLRNISVPATDTKPLELLHTL